MRKYLCILVVSLFFASIASAQKAAAKPSFDKYEIYAGYDFDRSFGDLNYFNASSANRYNAFAPFSTNGGQVSATYFLQKNFGIKADFAYSRKLASESSDMVGEDVKISNVYRQDSTSSSTTIQEVNISRSYVIGPVVRWTVPSIAAGRVSVFAQELMGATQYSMNLDYQGKPAGCNETGYACRAAGFTSVTGGGVNVRVNRYLSVRPAELDYWNHQINITHFTGGNYSEFGNGSLSANGFRYSAGVAATF